MIYMFERVTRVFNEISFAKSRMRARCFHVYHVSPCLPARISVHSTTNYKLSFAYYTNILIFFPYLGMT